MLKFKEFLNEYLLFDQEKGLKAAVEKAYPNHDNYMTPKAREATDHFFGENNDHIKEPLNNFDHDKSEVHQAVEKHLNKPITHEDYIKGTTSDQYGRQVKLGKLISDPKLRNDFASDNTRAGTKKNQQHYVSVVRGLESGGQTNSQPNAEHPKGHSWGDQSCKNISDGMNKHYLPHEIANGTVLVRVHDHNNAEIYRATLQPHTNREGKHAFALDAEYGVKHPDFTAHANDVASRLSGEYKGGLYTKNAKVYDNNRVKKILHPKVQDIDINKALSNKSLDQRMAAVTHPKATAAHLSKAQNDENEDIRDAVLNHKNVNEDHITKAIADPSVYVSMNAILNSKTTPDHVISALNDPRPHIRSFALNSHHVNENHLETALKDPDRSVRSSAVSHKKISKNQLTKALKDSDEDIRNMAKARLEKMG